MNLEDIARKAGVSRSTVSRVINNDPHVKATTRERVLAVIREENFQPNLAARALVKQRTQIIGVVIPTSENIFFTDNNYFPQLLAGLNQATREQKYAMLLWLGELTQNEEGLIHNRFADGLIIASLTADHPLSRRLGDIRRPLVMIDRPLHYNGDISYVTVNNVSAAEVAVEHLIGLGRRRIAHITGQLSIADARDRLQGYKNALTRAGLSVDPALIEESTFNRRMGYQATKRLLAQRPDAVFAAGDTIAVGVLQAAHEAGVRVPDDLALVGFDDIDVAAQAIPQLTTVRQPVQYKGAVAARLLIDLIEGRVSGPQHILLETELVVRQSCGAVRMPASEQFYQ